MNKLQNEIYGTNSFKRDKEEMKRIRTDKFQEYLATIKLDRET